MRIAGRGAGSGGQKAVALKLVDQRCLGAYAVGIALVLVLGVPLRNLKAQLRALIDRIDYVAEYRPIILPSVAGHAHKVGIVDVVDAYADIEVPLVPGMDSRRDPSAPTAYLPVACGVNALADSAYVCTEVIAGKQLGLNGQPLVNGLIEIHVKRTTVIMIGSASRRPVQFLDGPVTG